MRLSVTVDPKLLEEAKNLAGLRTKREVIEVVLREMIQHRRVHDMAKLEGSGSHSKYFLMEVTQIDP